VNIVRQAAAVSDIQMLIKLFEGQEAEAA